MTLKIDDSVKQQAIKLRAEGKSYAAIIATLSQYGATEWWVKSVTKGIKKKNTPIQDAVEAVYALASRKEGIKQYECNEIYYEMFGTVFDDQENKWVLNLTKSAKAQIRKQVREMAEQKGTTVAFVPDWMSTEFPEESRDRVEAYADHILSVLQETVADYVAEFDCCDESTIERELLSRIVKGYSKEPTRMRMKRINTVVGTLVVNKEKHAQNEAQSVVEVLTDEEGSRAS